MSKQPPVDALKAIAHPLRFCILERLKSGEMNVGEIEEATGIGQPALSQQLAVLRKAALVETRKEAKQVFYKLAKAELNDLAEAIGSLAGTARSPEKPGRKPSPGAANFARLS
ncbi:ArsR/SmtB family transcription factor [Altererythrobacter sp.]|uniref:ArsR/SmtB family transcription factor n=1 Tax=Altererythrobacter sp. TaxID=1872480 RepID=UPI003CFE5BEA